MALPDVAALKRYLKIENTAEDTLLAELLARAIAMTQTYLGCPIVAVELVQVDDAETNVWGAGGVRSLMVAVAPIDPATVAITDVDAVALDVSLLSIDGSAGLIRYVDGCRFRNGPYTITAPAGLSLRADYAVAVEPIVSSAIVDLVADLYQRRNPAATSERSAGGDAVSYAGGGMPARVCEALNLIREGL